MVLVEVLMGQLRYNAAEILLYQVSAPAPLPQLPHNFQLQMTCTLARFVQHGAAARLSHSQTGEADLVLLCQGVPTGVILSIAAWLMEGKGLVNVGFAIAAQNPWLIAGLGVSSAAVNLFSFLAIRLTSSLTFKTVGCMKNAFVVWLGVLLGDKVSRMQLVGYGIAMLGFVQYTVTQQRARQARQAQQSAAETKKTK